MNSDEMKNKIEQVLDETSNIAYDASTKIKDACERAFTKENAETLKHGAKEAIGNAKEFAEKTFTKDNAERLINTASAAFAKAKTSDGREQLKSEAKKKLVSIGDWIVKIWKSGRKGKTMLVIAAILVLLILKSCLSLDKTGNGLVAASENEECGAAVDFIERCQYCFHERLMSHRWETQPPCRKGHCHSYETIGAVGSRRFKCGKCGRKYELQCSPSSQGYIHCPTGGACQWSEL